MCIAVIGLAIPLCRWPLPRLCGFPSNRFIGQLFEEPITPLFEFGLPLESYPMIPTGNMQANLSDRRFRSSHGLWVPYSTCGIEGPLFAGMPAHFVPPSGFGDPPGGLRPSTLAGFISHRQRSWDFPFGGFSLRQVAESFFESARTCVPFHLCGSFEGAERFEPARQVSVSRLCPCRKSLVNRLGGLIPAITGSSLGFCPFQGLATETWIDFSADLLSQALRAQWFSPLLHGFPESLSVSVWSDPAMLRGIRSGNPHRVFAPARSDKHSNILAIRAMGSPCIGPHIAAGSPIR